MGYTEPTPKTSPTAPSRNSASSRTRRRDQSLAMFKGAMRYWWTWRELDLCIDFVDGSTRVVARYHTAARRILQTLSYTLRQTHATTPWRIELTFSTFAAASDHHRRLPSRTIPARGPCPVQGIRATFKVPSKPADSGLCRLKAPK